MDSSSSSSLPFAPPLQTKYDVFLSFRGEDTRDAFTSHLHAALLRKKIETYIDYRLEKGDDIGSTLLEAIEKSKIALVIFSKDYASSTWCLKELVHILGCKKRNNQIVIPIFYRTDPSHVRNQQGTYALAFAKLEERFKDSMDDPVLKWREALVEAANMSGFDDSSKTGTEADFVEEVAQDVLTKLNRESSSDFKGLVGIEEKIEKIESLLCFDLPGVCCVGIWGMGGIGKTTLAEAVFHTHSSKFEVCCFLANVRENSEKTDGLHQLRKKLVGEILNDKDVNIDTPSIPPCIQDRLRRTKALIVLDDVNARKQLEVLVGDDDRFCQGSRIIITARDKGLLEQKVDPEKIYDVEGLGFDDALRLFHSHAFGNKSTTTDYTELSREVMDYVKANPLALKVMGSSFRRCKSKQEWEVQWKKVKRVPIEEIQKVLRVSYDGLDDNEKEIFLDIACFHKGHMRNDVERMLDSCDFFGETGINDLIDRSLISISNGGLIEIHDLVQEMGRAIAREQRSRLFNDKDVYQVLINNQRDGHVQAISLDGGQWFHKIEKPHLELELANLKKMCQLRLLCVRNYIFMGIQGHRNIDSLDLPNSLRCLRWDLYPLKSLPSKFSTQNLVYLDMRYSNVEGLLWNEDQSPVNLKWINLSKCKHLTEVPNLSRSRKIEHIDLNGCQSLVEIPSYFQHLGKLTYLNLEDCTNLKNLPEMPCNLELLNLSGAAIEELPSSVWSHEKISDLDITYCEHLKSLPSNSCKLKLSDSLSLQGCKSLCEFWEFPTNTRKLDLSFGSFLTNVVSLPTNIWKLKSLVSLDLSCYSKFQNLPEISEAVEHLEFLNLSGTMVKEVPPSIGNLVALRNLDLRYCNNLVSLPTNIWKLKYLESLDLSGCSNFQHLPEISEAMEHLEFLSLSLTKVKEVPPSIGNLVALRKLYLFGCSIQEIPDDLFCLTSLQELNLCGTEIKSIPASIKQAAQLSRLFLNGCKSLESLPEFPPLLQRLKANGCTSLKTVSSSSTAITQGWEEYILSRGLHEIHIFSNCPKLDENARSNIMGDAQLRIMRMATASSKFKEDKIEQPSYDSDNSYDDYEVHDLVQEMGRAIAREQRSRLFNDEDVYQVLINNQRDGHVQAIYLDLYKIKKLHLELEHANFEKMYQLRFLCCFAVIQNRCNIVSLDLPNSLRYLCWERYPLKSLPSKFSAQNLVVLSMRNSQVVEQLWNEDQSPMNLKWIDLSECKHLTEVPNLSWILNIEHIDLNGCHSLVEIPSYFQHLGKLTYLNLEQCINLKNLPEMPCNLEFLNLSWTTIEELPSSVWSHEKIYHLDITNCVHLKNLPSNSCKLKLSDSLDLYGCESLCEFWELPSGTTMLELSGTAIIELRNESIESVVGLTAIKLRNCESLVSLPTNIWKLKYLESLHLSGCSNFQHLPEISEAMEHLEYLNLSGTMVKEVPKSIGNLVALRTLRLAECSIQEIPDDLFRLTSLQKLNLSGTEIKSIPASIKQAAQLSRLFLNGCKSLESLPEFPPLLQRFETYGCTSLKTVSSSSTTITQGWEEYILSRGLHEKHIFSNCPKLDENARSNIMGDAQLRIMRMATASSKFKEDKIEQPSYDSDNSYDDYEESFVAISCPGNEIPNWFSHKSEGCSIKIELPRDWFSTDFLGFALSLVVDVVVDQFAWHRDIICKCNFKTSKGESHEVNHRLYAPHLLYDRDSHEVYVWWDNNVFEEVVEGAQSLAAFYKLVTEVNVDFTVTLRGRASVRVEKCGICMLYGKDVEMIKQRAL